MRELYYLPPPDKAFKELKRACMEKWATMGAEQSYRDEKIGRIKDIENVEDNFMYLFAMFDHGNQRIIASRLSEATKQELRDRLKAGGNDEAFINAILTV